MEKYILFCKKKFPIILISKVLVTNLWSIANNLNSNEIASNILNINQSILSLKTGKFHKLSKDKDVLFVGTSSSLLVFDVENNSDVFYKEVIGYECPIQLLHPDNRLV